jgi:hypothetical protein
MQESRRRARHAAPLEAAVRPARARSDIARRRGNRPWHVLDPDVVLRQRQARRRREHHDHRLAQSRRVERLQDVPRKGDPDQRRHGHPGARADRERQRFRQDRRHPGQGDDVQHRPRIRRPHPVVRRNPPAAFNRRGLRQLDGHLRRQGVRRPRENSPPVRHARRNVPKP